MEGLADFNKRCGVCDRAYDPGQEECRNPLCMSSHRQFNWNFAIAMRSGALERAINAYKYDGRRGWAIIFGRILAGFLEQEAQTFRDFDLIIASPTYVGVDGRDFDHTRLVLQYAAEDVAPGNSWPFDLNDVPVIIKTGPTESFATKTYAQRRDSAQTQLRDALQVPDPRRTNGTRILVYDDVFTDGHTLNEVARSLLVLGGATEVCGVTLCRQPFRGHPAPATT
jgi:predicted amidophosphoribosyltransferase